MAIWSHWPGTPGPCAAWVRKNAAAEAERRVKEHKPLDAVRQGVEALVKLVRRVEGYQTGKERQPRDTAARTDTSRPA